jgi:ribulose bisphosphate carboxylase small subunit
MLPTLPCTAPAVWPRCELDRVHARVWRHIGLLAAQTEIEALRHENERLRRDNERFVRIIDSGEWGRGRVAELVQVRVPALPAAAVQMAGRDWLLL